MALKTSILVFYLTLTRTNKSFRWANYTTIFVVNAAGLALTMLNVFQCSPVRAAIYSDIPNAHCVDIVTLYLSSAPVNLATDVAIFFLPIPILTRMRLPKKQKIILVVTFSFGFFTAVVDVLRVAYLQSAATTRALTIQNNEERRTQSLSSQDFSCRTCPFLFFWFENDFVQYINPWCVGYGAFTLMWSSVEVNIGIICACVPSLKPLAARLLPRLIRGSGDTVTASANEIRYYDARSGSPPPSRLEPPPATPALAPNRRGSRLSGSPQVSNRGSDSSATQVSSEPTHPEEYVTIMDFLAAPPPGHADMESSVATDAGSTPQNITFYDFVTIKKPKSMLKMSNRESIPPVALITILFFLWGVAYGFLDILNHQFQEVTGVSEWGSVGLHAAYYCGYLAAPMTVGWWVLSRWGFKRTFITGLCIYACGALIFWPSAVLTSFAAFTVSNFIVGSGLAILETAANPFIALCGPLENSEVRLNFSQGVQAIGSVVAPLLARKVFFRSVHSAARLVEVQWTYLAISLFDILLAVAFYYLPVPEASDDDLQDLANKRKEVNSSKVAGLIPTVWLTLGLGVLSEFCYTGAQEGLSTTFEALAVANRCTGSTSACPGPLQPFDYFLIGRSMFAVGRFLTALAQWFLPPRWILLALYVGMLVVAILIRQLTGVAGVAMGLMLFFFESGVFSTVFAISLRGLGRRTKRGAAILTTTVSAAAIFPWPQLAYRLARNMAEHPTRRSFIVILPLIAVGCLFPLYLNLVPEAREQVDPIPGVILRHGPGGSRRRQAGRSRPGSSHHSRHSSRSGGKDMVDIPRAATVSSQGGVYSRPRSVVDPDERVDEDDDVRRRDGWHGVMHDLAPWPD